MESSLLPQRLEGGGGGRAVELFAHPVEHQLPEGGTHRGELANRPRARARGPNEVEREPGAHVAQSRIAQQGGVRSSRLRSRLGRLPKKGTLRGRASSIIKRSPHIVTRAGSGSGAGGRSPPPPTGCMGSWLRLLARSIAPAVTLAAARCASPVVGAAGGAAVAPALKAAVCTGTVTGVVAGAVGGPVA